MPRDLTPGRLKIAIAVILVVLAVALAVLKAMRPFPF